MLQGNLVGSNELLLFFHLISVRVRGSMQPDTYKPVLTVSVHPIKLEDGFQVYHFIFSRMGVVWKYDAFYVTITNLELVGETL